MTFEIRILGSGDHAVLGQVAPDVFDNAIDPRLALEFLGDERHHLVVAIDQNRVVGFVSAVDYVHPDKPRELWINEVGVSASYQGQGIGTAMLQALLRHAESLGCREAWVLTDRANDAAMRLYTATGGREAESDAVMFTFFLNRDDRTRPA